ncbi:MAG: alpha/beta hydrolase-fold protein [Candidatus Kapaibacterium sp.]|nr:esterase [Bacteroidota bacterium]
MKRVINNWFSPRLNKKMEIVTYGDYGFALLLFPSAAADYLEYERFYLIESIKPFIEKGMIKVYSINSINSESWLNSNMRPKAKAIRHQQYNGYITEEVVPFIYNSCNSVVPIVTSGVSLGAFHAANSMLRRPDLFTGTIAMSGTYNLKWYTDGYWDENCYYNSPVHYLPGMNDSHWLPILQQRKDIYFMTGQGPYEHPQSSIEMGNLLGKKGIPNYIDVWSKDYSHDWPTWRDMLPNALSKWFSK